ncbi:unnamed protein product [Prorocentrum cordatum]|uniref:Uncharacterized protein n=1 Tax=Prorocentrum cordatum TaxID=2364126 RepID=A0ABN9XW98_9DINO|nr:unnamed protein product [Polarella glacialis]
MRRPAAPRRSGGRPAPVAALACAAVAGAGARGLGGSSFAAAAAPPLARGAAAAGLRLARRRAQAVKVPMSARAEAEAEAEAIRADAGASSGSSKAPSVPISGDGRALDTSGPVGAVGTLVVSLAVLPYVPVSLYNSFILATTGRGLELAAGPEGIYGPKDGVYGIAAILAVSGVVLWSLTSRVFRGCGLPSGLFALLRLTEGVSYLAVVAFSIAVALNQLEPEDNPVLGFSFDAPEKSAQVFSAKSIKGLDKAGKYLEKETAPSRALLNAALDDVAKQASEKASEISKRASEKADDVAKQASERANSFQEGLSKRVSNVKAPVLRGTTDALKGGGEETVSV